MLADSILHAALTETTPAERRRAGRLARILGDDEADARLKTVCRILRRPDVQCVSVKATAMCANLDVLAFDFSVSRVVEQLRSVLRVAAAARPPKLVYLDMEEYRDLQVTV